MINKTTTVYWAPYLNKDTGDPAIELLTLEPELVFPTLVKERNKETAFLKCPAIIEFFKNTYLVRSPIDMEFKVINNSTVISKSPKGIVETYLQLSNSAATDFYPNFQLRIYYLCFSKSNVEIQQLPAFMHHNGFTGYVNLISGGFNISKWMRPLSVAFEVPEAEREIKIKRGDPLYYIKFVTDNNKPVKLERIELNNKLIKLVDSCLDVKYLMKNNSLWENYKLASFSIKRFWNPSKCPWGKRIGGIE